MDIQFDLNTESNVIRKIEDVIDLQKANGNINVKQVAFDLSSETKSNISSTCAKSLETGLSKDKSEKQKKKAKRRRLKQFKATSDVMSWPSDSDITVLRMKLSRNVAKDKMSNVLLGDGLHQSDSHSMVNLATLIIQSQTPSKHSLNFEELLLPLTSWGNVKGTNKSTRGTPNSPGENQYSNEENDSPFKDCEVGDITVKSKVARFLRLYFCPCCTCLYNLETTQEKQKLNNE